MVQLKESAVTRELFSKYVEIQREGKYNMIMDAKKIMAILGCTAEQYKEILNTYSTLSKQFGISI